MKIKVGSNIEQDIARINAVRQAVDPGIKLRIDANEQYIKDAKIFCDAVKDFDLQPFEQPVHQG